MGKGTLHNYNWLFCELKNSLLRAKADKEFNRRYRFYEQKERGRVQWPQDFLDELALHYSRVVGFEICGSRLRAKIFNTRVNAFRQLAERSTFAADYDYVERFNPSSLVIVEFRKPIRDFKPVPCSGLAEQILECNFPVHLSLELLGLVVDEQGRDALNGFDGELRMAVLLNQHLA